MSFAKHSVVVLTSLALLVSQAPPATAAPAAPSTTADGPTLSGGSFEGVPAGSIADGWSISGPGSAAVSPEAARTGQQGVRITSTPEAPTSITSPSIELKKAVQSVYYRGLIRSAAGSVKATLRVTFFAANGAKISEERSEILSTGQTWKEISLTAVTPVKAKSLQVSIDVAGEGAIDIDDISPITRDQVQLVSNGGAEEITEPSGPVDWQQSAVQWQPVTIANPSAEEGATSPTNWKTANYGSVPAKMTWDSSTAHSGSRSLKISGVQGSVGDWQTVNHAAIGLGTYKFGFWIKAENAGEGDIRPLVIFRNAKGQTIGGDRVVENTLTTTDWTYIETTLTAPPGTVAVRIDYRLYNGGTAWFDDVTIEKQAFTDEVAEGNIATTDDSAAASGARSFVISNQGADDQTSLVSAPMPIERLAGYDLSVAMQTQLDGGTAQSGLQYLNAEGVVLGEAATQNVQGTSSWTNASVQGFPPAAATEARAFMRVSGKGSAHFDNVTLIRSTVVDPNAKPVERPALLLGKDEVKALRERTTSGPVGDEYQRQVELSNRWTVDQLQEPSYLINAHRSQSSLFNAPAGAASMKVSLTGAGAGTASVDKITLSALANGQSVPLEDPSFESFGTPESSWQTREATGEAGFTRSTEWAADGTASLKYSGSEAGDKAVVALDQIIPASGGARYSLQAVISQQGLIEGTGLTWRVDFSDESGAPVGNAYTAPSYNWDTHTRWDSPLFEATQASANVYLVSGDEVAAQKAILGLKYLVGESIWGMSHVLSTGGRPNGEDGYGAVHFGRAMGGFAQAYDLIASSKSLTDEDRVWIEDRLGWMQDTQMNIAYYDRSTEAGRISNWNLDRAIGVGMVAMAVPSLSSANRYRTHAAEEVEWTLDTVVTDEGAFPETIRYHVAPLVRLAPFTQALDRATGTDLVNHPKLKKMYSFLIDVQTPVDTTNTKAPGTLLTPAIGDSDFDEGAYRTLGWNAATYRDSDPALSQAMQWTWKRAGEPVKDTGVNPWPLQPLLRTDSTLPAADPGLKSSAYASIGYDILRSNVGTTDENYFVMSNTPTPLGHNHDDRTAFSLWGKSTPLALDPGVGGYFNGDNVWFNSAAAHNVVQFQSGSNWLGTASTVETPLRHHSPLADVVRVGGATPGAAEHERTVVHLKGGLDSFLIWDRVESDNNSRFNLHTLSTSIDEGKDRITAHGYEGTDLDIHLLGSAPSVTLSEGRISGDWPQENQQWLQLGQPAGKDHIVLLQPRDESSEALTVTPLDTGNTALQAFRATGPDGEEAVIVLNGGASDAHAALGLDSEWTAATPSSSGAISGTGVDVAAGQTVVLFPAP